MKLANNLISKAIFTKLEEHGIHTHYVGPGSNKEFHWIMIYNKDKVLKYNKLL